jgi:predicted transcriptional regulator YdeE
MQWLKIILVLLFFILIAFLAFLLIPVNRTFHTKLGLDISDVTVFRALSDTTKWRNWYPVDHSPSSHGLSIHFDSLATNRLVKYAAGGDDEISWKGEIKINPKKIHKDESVLEWEEKVVIRKNIYEKLRILFDPSGYSDRFLGTVSKFKGRMDHFADQLSGIRMEILDIPSLDLAARTDTVPLSQIEDQIREIYKEIITHFRDNQLKYPDLIQSRYRMLNDSTVEILVGAVLKDSIAVVKAPLKKLEIPAYKVLVVHAEGHFADIKDDMKIMDDWLKKHAARKASDFWLEHQFQFDSPGSKKSHSFNIVQPVYFLK